MPKFESILNDRSGTIGAQGINLSHTLALIDTLVQFIGIQLTQSRLSRSPSIQASKPIMLVMVILCILKVWCRALKATRPTRVKQRCNTKFKKHAVSSMVWYIFINFIKILIIYAWVVEKEMEVSCDIHTRLMSLWTITIPYTRIMKYYMYIIKHDWIQHQMTYHPGDVPIQGVLLNPDLSSSPFQINFIHKLS